MNTTTTPSVQVKNFIGGHWTIAKTTEVLPIHNPATETVLGTVPVGSASDVSDAVGAASRAFQGWRRTPPADRVQFLFKLKNILELHFHEIACVITHENGKTVAEAEGERRRAIENVEVACGIPTLMQGYNLEDVATGIDEIMVRQPLGVVAAITPFNFPAMIPFWFLTTLAQDVESRFPDVASGEDSKAFWIHELTDTCMQFPFPPVVASVQRELCCASR